MKKVVIIILLILTSWNVFAHEDTYKAVEKSNVHIMMQVGYESSWELRIVESYAEIINDFIKEIDSTEKVFIHFDEDYCFSYDDLYFLANGNFKLFIPLGFPWGYKYDMNFINTQKGIGIIISEKYFSLKTLLQLLEFGLQNKNYIIEKKNIVKRIINRLDGKYVHETGTADIIDSILQSETSTLIEKYLSKRTELRDFFNITFFLQNDSILIADKKGNEIVKTATINSVSCDSATNCWFISNTNHSFYFINQDLKSNQKQYNLPFKIGCSDWIEIKCINKKSKYKLEKNGWYRSKDDKEWIYFDEINGITESKKKSN